MHPAGLGMCWNPCFTRNGCAIHSLQGIGVRDGRGRSEIVGKDDRSKGFSLSPDLSLSSSITLHVDLMSWLRTGALHHGLLHLGPQFPLASPLPCLSAGLNSHNEGDHRIRLLAGSLPPWFLGKRNSPSIGVALELLCPQIPCLVAVSTSTHCIRSVACPQSLERT